MRHGLALGALLLPLAGCYVPPGPPAPYGYGYPPPGYPPGYPQPGYPQPGYPGAVQDFSYPGFTYYDGSPTLFVEGAAVPLIFFGGGWGYYDRDRHFHRAPDAVGRHLEGRFPGGQGYRPWSGNLARPEGPRPGGYPGPGYPGGYRPGEPPPGGAFPGAFRPGGPPPGGVVPGAFRPGGPPPGGPPPGGPPGGAFPRAFHPGGPLPGAPVPQVQHAAPPPAVSRPSSTPPERHRDDRQH